MSVTRQLWLHHLERMVTPVLTHFATGQLKAVMPVEGDSERIHERRQVSHLEAIARSLAGIAPWLQGTDGDAAEVALRNQLFELARAGLEHGLSSEHDYLRNDTNQDLVEAAFLAQALLRCPRLLASLSAAATEGLVRSLQLRRPILPPYNNWLLFAAEVEALLHRLDAEWDILRVDYALRQHEAWYKGDGVYGDGPELHNDFYNSYVIQPMLLEVAETVGDPQGRWEGFSERFVTRARRFAAVQERMIASDGSFPVIGRSITYRGGAFQALAQSALREDLPDGVSAAQVRCALTAVIQRTLEPTGTYDDDGWLRIGLAGHQPSLGEAYITTGSLYLASQIFLPLGLPASAPFWRDEDQPWTAVKAWSGIDMQRDGALYWS